MPRKFTPEQPNTRRAQALFSLMVVLSLSACVSPTPAPRPSSALTLTLGTLFPASAAGDQIGPRTRAAVALAVADISAARAGITVRAISADGAPSAGAPSAGAATDAAAAAALLAGGVTAVIGAASSGLSKANIERFSRASVVQLSPSDGATELSTSPDDGLYWRTAASDTLRGRALGNRILTDGALRVGILYVNDSSGTATQAGVADALTAGGAATASEIYEPGTTDFSSALDRILLATPDAVVVISGPELSRIAEALTARSFDFTRLYGVDRNVNSLRGSAVDAAGARFSVPGAVTAAALDARLPTLTGTGTGTGTGAGTGDGTGEASPVDQSFAPEAYDATMLIALAALKGGSVDARVISAGLREVASGGSRCASFAACARLMARGANIDYEGQSGRIVFNSRGDVTSAQTRIFRLAAGNLPVFSGVASSSR